MWTCLEYCWHILELAGAGAGRRLLVMKSLLKSFNFLFLIYYSIYLRQTPLAFRLNWPTLDHESRFLVSVKSRQLICYSWQSAGIGGTCSSSRIICSEQSINVKLVEVLFIPRKEVVLKERWGSNNTVKTSRSSSAQPRSAPHCRLPGSESKMVFFFPLSQFMFFVSCSPKGSPN